MNYIRTKDGIYEEYAREKRLNGYVITTSNIRILYTAILRESDTIEELCDVFVYAKCDYMELEEAKREKEMNESDWQQDGLPIYGAIWTEKGLIYVAKMNYKGDLELI